MTTENSLSPVRVTMQAGPGQPDPSPALERLYRGFEQELLVPLWTEIGDLMPLHPQSKATPHLWRWDRLVSLADEAGRLVPVGDAAALGAALVDMLSDGAARARYIAAASEAVGRYDWSVVADEIVRVYETVAGAGVKVQVAS